MSKQTVQERYNQNQAMKGTLIPKSKVNKESQTEQNKELLHIFNATKQSLQEAQQAVRQAQGANPVQPQLRFADDRLTNAIQLMQQVQILTPDFVLGVSKAEQQQLKQLDYQIEKASKTLQMIQQSIIPN